jgi:hypothetical protein
MPQLIRGPAARGSPASKLDTLRVAQAPVPRLDRFARTTRQCARWRECLVAGSMNGPSVRINVALHARLERGFAASIAAGSFAARKRCLAGSVYGRMSLLFRVARPEAMGLWIAGQVAEEYDLGLRSDEDDSLTAVVRGLVN